MPTWQAVHGGTSVPFSPVNPSLHTQALEVLLPAGDVDPAGHGEHSPAPGVSLNVPGLQFAQDASPAMSLNVPGWQDWHEPPFRPEYPGRHTQSVIWELASSEVELSGHVSQGESPAKLLYVPAAQAWHSPPSGPAYPLLHTQAMMDGLAEGELAWAGQRVQADDPAWSSYKPAAQGKHAELPVTFL